MGVCEDAASGVQRSALKAQALYLRLDHDRRKGVYDRERFLEYLKLPRSFFYVNPKWLQTYVRTGQPLCDLSANLAEPLLVARGIGDDEPLVARLLPPVLCRGQARQRDGRTACAVD